MSSKLLLLDSLAEEVIMELDLIESSDDEEELIDTFIEDAAVVVSYRYAYQNKVPKSRNWFADVLPNLDDRRFKQMLRVTRDQFKVILELIKGHQVFAGENSFHQFPIWEQLALTLFRLGSSGDAASVTKISALFGIGDGGTIDRITKRVFNAVLALENRFIKWPDQQERNDLVIQTLEELPRCIGYVDGSEIHLAEAPGLDHVSYYSRKQRYGIKMQAICDCNLKIRHLVIGYPGSVHDARIFANCQLALNPSEHFSDSQWIAADSAYRLTETVITPFRRNSAVNNKSKFNRYFSSFRVRIENCFGMLKEKFTSLKELRIRIKDASSHKFACDWIHVCCILHNIILPYMDSSDFVDLPEQADIQDEYGQTDENAGVIKRQALLEIVLDKIT